MPGRRADEGVCRDPETIEKGSKVTKIADFINEESGAAAAEYSLILAFVALAIIVALENLGSGVANSVNAVSTAMP